jgi:hypothetical protein
MMMMMTTDDHRTVEEVMLLHVAGHAKYPTKHKLLRDSRKELYATREKGYKTLVKGRRAVTRTCVQSFT